MRQGTSERALNLNSRIFWRITVAIFISILLIEAVLLGYSWFAERDRKIARVEELFSAVVSLLDHNNPAVQLDALLESPVSDSQLILTGYLHIGVDGTVDAAGDIIGIQKHITAEDPTHFGSQSGTLTSYLESADGKEQYWMRSDASWILSYMNSYVVRIVGMVMLLSLFVTGACLVFLTPLLINPLQRLNALLVQGEKLGIESAAPMKKDKRRNDELGGVFKSFELLRTRLLDSEQENLAITNRFETFANMGADCFWETDEQMRIVYIAGDIGRVSSLSVEEIIGRTIAELIAEARAFEDETFPLTLSLQNRGQWNGEIKTTGDEDTPTSVRIVYEPLTNASGVNIGHRGTMTDTSKEHTLAKELKYQAMRDELTGLANRRELTNQVQQAITEYKENKRDFSLLMIDLDRFKTVNDSCGHTAGDMLIKALSNIMANAVGDDDTVARIGGDEFAVLLRSRSLEASREIAERIRHLIEDFTFYWDQQAYRVSSSIGVAQAADELDTQEALIFAADSCCLKAKQQGKNQVQVYSQEDTSFKLFRDEALWISRILQAIENDEFSLFKQSIVPVSSSNKEDHFEILLRMKNSEGGFWLPGFFLGVAERNDLMPRIDAWVVNAALDWLARQRFSEDYNFCMNINLSGASLSDAKFREFLFNRVNENPHLNHHVCFEITETAAMVNFDETLTLLCELKERGCQVALDDFGTGFSSLAHIKNLPLDYIKIDGVFIRNICDNEFDQTVVNSVAEIARVLNIKTVAEFVESEATLRILERINIDYAQGYLFSKPEELSDGDDAKYRKKAA